MMDFNGHSNPRESAWLNFHVNKPQIGDGTWATAQEPLVKMVTSAAGRSATCDRDVELNSSLCSRRRTVRSQDTLANFDPSGEREKERMVSRIVFSYDAGRSLLPLPDHSRHQILSL